MKILVYFLIILLSYGCSKTKTVLICGDHVCVNKDEAEQYFEDNLSLEVKVVDTNKSDNIDLIELNMRSNQQGGKEIRVFKRNKTKNKIVKLSKIEVKKKKNELKLRKENKKKQSTKLKKTNQAKLIINKSKKVDKKDTLKPIRNYNKSNEEIVDICTIIKKCNIKEISKFLIKQGKEKKFPDITIRE